MFGKNRDSMLRLMEAAHVGLKGQLRDAATGRPLRARVTATAPPSAWPVKVRPQHLDE
jgi:hypothetical protein